MITPILYYSPFCPICPGVVERCVEYFNQKRILLVVRMPSLAEKSKLSGLPALFVPRELGDFDSAYLLVGEDIPKWLESVKDRIVAK